MSLIGYDSCPSCKTSNVKRSHRRNILERVFSMAALPYRCDICDKRFFVPRWKALPDSVKEKSKAAGA